MVGKSLPNRTLPSRSREPRQQRVGVRRGGVEEVGERHRGVEVRPLVPLGEVEELGVLRGTHVRDHRGQPRVPLEHAAQRVGPGELVADRPGTGMDDHRRAGLGDHAPDLVEHRVVEVEVPHLHVHLEHLDPGRDQVRDVRRRLRLRVERRRPQALRHPLGEAARPVVQVARDPRPVRVGQRAEPAYAEAPQRGDPLLLGAAVADRPLPADQRAGEVELRPHPGLDVGRQEVHVHVEEPGQAEAPPAVEDLRGVGRLEHQRATPCP